MSSLTDASRIACGATVTVVRGTPASLFIWRNVAPRLARRYKACVFDLLDFSDPERPADLATPNLDVIARDEHAGA